MFNEIHGQLGLSLCHILLTAGRSACIGLGFADRGDSFDLLVSLQDHFKWVFLSFFQVFQAEILDFKDCLSGH